MSTEILLVAVFILGAFAVMDLVVGVGNDAVNFLNSSLGSKVAPRHVIFLIASLGIIAGVTFSSGMMEVARKGIFHPQFFTLPDLLAIFFGVMLTDVILLDLFNTYGMPTSTTVSIVFELLGGAVAASIYKIVSTSGNLADIADYINTGKALLIIFSILLSVVIAFITGAIVQFFSRLLFTFEYKKRMARYGSLWSALAMASLTYFILVKGAKGASFLTPDKVLWIHANTYKILSTLFVVSAIGLQLIQMIFGINILKIIVLMGTFALAMAFAANDLVNFIGVPMAGMHAYKFAIASGDPLHVTMSALGKSVPSETYLLLISGAIMVATLWLSKKARTVSKTELRLGNQSEDIESEDTSLLARVVVRMVTQFLSGIRTLIPNNIWDMLERRFDATKYQSHLKEEERSSFDLLRASVNLMTAGALVSYATSHKLPLSTTYVTFMVSMGTSFADRAWGRDNAVYRITGVFNVIGGWFLTAFLAFTTCFIFTSVINYLKIPGVGILVAVVAFVIWTNHRKHLTKSSEESREEIFNLKKIKDAKSSINITFEHASIFLQEIKESLDNTLEALYKEDLSGLRKENRKLTKIQKWANIITANVFKSLRLLQINQVDIPYKYSRTMRRLQRIADSHRDIVIRSYRHIRNNHENLLPEQQEELKKVFKVLHDILETSVATLYNIKEFDEAGVLKMDAKLIELSDKLNETQIHRIVDETSKTRLTILYYALMGNARIISKQSISLMQIFEGSFARRISK